MNWPPWQSLLVILGVVMSLPTWLQPTLMFALAAYIVSVLVGALTENLRGIA